MTGVSCVTGNNTVVAINPPGAVTISEERKVCTGSEKFIKMCDSNEVRRHTEVSSSCTRSDSEDNLVASLCLQLDLTFHLFVCALAGAGAAVIAMVSSSTHPPTHSQRQTDGFEHALFQPF